MKTCTKCLIEKHEEFFNWKNKAKNTRHAMCKACCSHAQKHQYKRTDTGAINRRLSNKRGDQMRRKRNREFVWNYLSQNPCGQCGETDPIVLEFDHRDPSLKITEVCTMVGGGWGLQKIEEEIAKCDILCANCHRRRTAKQLAWWSDFGSGSGARTHD